jgi:predicted RNA binding protein YcfA (HicA-like mRNA interferase family)
MARAKEYSFREFQLLLSKNGYDCKRVSGDHFLYTNGKTVISIPCHGKKLNRMLCRGLIKRNGLKVI